MKIASGWRWLGSAWLGAVSFACSAAPPPQGNTGKSPTAPTEAPAVPSLPSASLAVPEGNRLAFALDATGVQIYACQAQDSGVAWALQGPEASLTDRSGQAQVKHYAGPTWEWSSDGSKVKATKVAGFSADAGAIPLLLLKVSAHEGQGQMSDVSYIQRLATQKGVAPSAGCDASHVGQQVRVDYAATYYFYRGPR